MGLGCRQADIDSMLCTVQVPPVQTVCERFDPMCCASHACKHASQHAACAKQLALVHMSCQSMLLLSPSDSSAPSSRGEKQPSAFKHVSHLHAITTGVGWQPSRLAPFALTHTMINHLELASTATVPILMLLRHVYTMQQQQLPSVLLESGQLQLAPGWGDTNLANRLRHAI
jgi:hypothetical protein